MGARTLQAAVIALAVLGGPDAAFAAGEAANGSALARRWCASCHAIEGAKVTADTAPSFTALAAKNRSNPGWVESWLLHPHLPMTGISLSRSDVADIQAYLRELASRSP